MLFFKKCTLLLFYFSASAIGQTLILDKETAQPIPFVCIISEQGSVITTSNIDGVIEINKLDSNKNKFVVIHHLTYQNLKISLNKLKSLDSVFLTQSSITLPKVVVTSNHEYILLKGYYRSYELNDSIPKFYVDGLVEYYIPIRKEKKLKVKILQHRSYRNIELLKKEKKRANMLVMRLARIPSIYYDNALKIINKKKYSVTELSKYDKVVKKNSDIVGLIMQKKDSSYIRINLDLLAPKSNKTGTLFGYTSKITKNTVTEDYLFDELSSLSLQDLVRKKTYRKIFFKHKKDVKFVQLEGINELYIYDRAFTTKAKYKSIVRNKSKPSYTEEYWKNLEDKGVPKLPEFIENQLGTTLTLKIY